MKIILPLLVVLITGVVLYVVVKNPPAREVKPLKEVKTYVESLIIKGEDFPVEIKSYGVAQPKINSKLIAELSGIVRYVSEKAYNGNFFKKGEVLIEIDNRDYLLSVELAKAQLEKAKAEDEEEKIRSENFQTNLVNTKNVYEQKKLFYIEEEARSKQALEDWQKFGSKEVASELALRKPQLEAAKMAVVAALAEVDKSVRELALVKPILEKSLALVKALEAEVKKAELELERCVIKAPYDGFSVNKFVNIGQFVSHGVVLVEIFGEEEVEIKLPVAAKDLHFISFEKPGQDKLKVELTADYGKELITWEGVIDRSEGVVDEKTRQHYFVATVKKPFAGKYPLKPGSFVNAKITGKILKDIVLLPTESVRDNDFVWVIDSQNKLVKRGVEVIWRTDSNVVVNGLQNGEKVCLTSLNFAREGLVVNEIEKKIKRDDK